MPKKIRQLKKMLSDAGFEYVPGRGKGSHSYWNPVSPTVVILSGQDSSDAKPYLEKQVKNAIKEVKDSAS